MDSTPEKETKEYQPSLFRKENTIEIQWLTDENDCDTCGPCYAEGAKVLLNGEPLLDLIPAAACFNGDDYSSSEVFLRILGELGYEVDFSYEEDVYGE